MKRNLLWKFLFLCFLVGWSWFEIYPPTGRDLLAEFVSRADSAAKDATFESIVQAARHLETQRPGQAYGNLRLAIGTNDIRKYFPGFDPKGDPEPTRAILNRLQRDAAGKIRLGLDLQGGQSFLVSLDTNKLDTAADKSQVLAQAIEVLRKRVDKFGVAEPVIQPAGTDRILIQMPGLSEAEKEAARIQISKPAFLEFRMVHPQSAELIAQGLIEPGYEILREERIGPDGQKSYQEYLVKKKAERGLTGKYIRRAMGLPNPLTGIPEIVFDLDSEGARLFGEITTEHTGHFMAIVLDGVVYSAPRINEPITGGRAQITGDFTIKQAIELANVLENPLEAPLRIEEERGVDPTLGADSIKAGINASLLGIALVSSFMLVYYLLAGVVANIALLLNVLIMLGVMCSIGTTLTLPGIAGIVLTIGMAVDANVLIFERMREEFAAGKSLRGAIAAGYDKAFGTIFDSNITTLIAAILLIFLGTGPVKGFGVTLTIGLCTSMFTALVVTRMVFDFLVQRGWLKSLPMLRLIGQTRIDFLKIAIPAFAAAWLLILVGNVVTVKRFAEGSLLGVDFAGGDSLTLSFKERVDVDRVREALKKLGAGEPQIQYQKNLGTGLETLQVMTAYEKGPAAYELLKKEFPTADFTQLSQDRVGPSVGAEITRSAVVATLLALFGILVYVAFRYEFSFSVGAVVAILHDLLMTAGVFSLAGLELSAPIVAAFLTIIGFSINDTIVIFDRVREDLKLGVRGSFKDVINIALNQTLSRTIITSGTVFLSTFALYYFGGGAIKDFAFTLLVGIVSGTFSTIYIASALVLWWHKGQRPKTGAGAQVTLESPAAARA
jgi:SecD/SecF fusion protein